MENKEKTELLARTFAKAHCGGNLSNYKRGQRKKQ